MFCRILRDEMTQIILRFIINDITPIIVLSRNSVRVVLLIAQGWRAEVLATLGYNHLKSDRRQTILLALSLKRHCHLLLSHLFEVRHWFYFPMSSRHVDCHCAG